MGGACSNYGEGERRVQCFGWERNNWGDPGVDGRIEDGSPGSGMWGLWTGSSWLRIGTGGGHL